MTDRIFYTGSLEYLDGTVTASVPLDTQPVHLSYDGGATWLAAEWIGDPGTTRGVQTVDKITWAGPSRTVSVYARVADDEIPVIKIGTISIIAVTPQPTYATYEPFVNEAQEAAAVAQEAAAAAAVFNPASYMHRTTPSGHAPALGLYFPEVHGTVNPAGTNDTAAAIQGAIDAANAAGGGQVVLAPEKTYGLGAQVSVKSNVELRGGRLKMLATATSRGVLISGASNVKIRDVVIDMNRAATTNGNANTQQQGIYINTASAAMTDIVIDNVSVLNSHQRGIAVVVTATGSLKRLSILGCYVNNVGERGIFVDGSTPTTDAHVDIERCKVSGVGNVGIAVQSVTGVNIRGCSVDVTGSTQHGILISGSGANNHVVAARITDNHVIGAPATKWGIICSVKSARVTISGNIVEGCGGGISIDPEDSAAVGVETTVNGTISGNSCRDSLDLHGIYVRLSSNVAITGNVCATNYQSGIAVTTATRVAVAGNVCHANGTHGIGFHGGTAGGFHTVGANVTHGNGTRGGGGVDLYVDPAIPNAVTVVS